MSTCAVGGRFFVKNAAREVAERAVKQCRGGSRIVFRRGCTRLLLYFNTNKPHFFFAEYQLH